MRPANPATRLLFRTLTGTARFAAGVAGGGGGSAAVVGTACVAVVVAAALLDPAPADPVPGEDAAVAEVAVVAAAAVLVVLDGAADSESASDFDSDMAPRPAKTMASAINTIASARRGGPPEVELG